MKFGPGLSLGSIAQISDGRKYTEDLAYAEDINISEVYLRQNIES